MTEQSPVCDTVPPRDGRDSTSPIGAAMALYRPLTGSASEPTSTPSPTTPCRSSNHEAYEASLATEKRLGDETTARAMYGRSGVPRRHAEQAKRLSEACPEWSQCRDRVCNGLGSGFLFALAGTRGPGKTQIAQQAIAASCRALREARYARAMDVFLSIRESYRKDSARSEGQVVEQFRSPKLLVIDEIQERGETPWEDRILTNLIDKRYGDASDTLLIANLMPEALKESLGASIFDRLRETGGIIKCTWPTFRGKPAPMPEAY